MVMSDKQDGSDVPDPSAPACYGCAVWAMFGKQCWYFWEGKKHCSVWSANPADAKRQL